MKRFFKGYKHILFHGKPLDRVAGWLIILLVIALLANTFMTLSNKAVKKIPASNFIIELENDNIKKMDICHSDGSVNGEFREAIDADDNNEGYLYFTTSVAETSNILTQTYLDELNKSHEKANTSEDYEVLEYSYSKPSNLSTMLITMIGFVIQLGLIFGLLIFVMKRQGMDLFGSSSSKIDKTIPDASFDDVIGVPEAIEEISEVVTFLKDPKTYNKAGAKFPKGILMQGPSGTGKTLLARSLAGEAGVPFIHTSGSDFIEMYVGMGAKRVRDVFAAAKEAQPSILFIDEIDAVGGDREQSSSSGTSENLQTINALLSEMDGFDTNSSVVVIAATNRADSLDKALLRPGRFDKIICVDTPAKEGRIEILQHYAQDKPFAEPVNFDKLAMHTYGFSGAELENVINQAATLAARRAAEKRETPAITMEDLDEGISRTISGPAMKSKQLTDEEKKQTSYHEAGHAVVQYLLPNCDEVQKISIISRHMPGVGMALGYVQSYSEEDSFVTTANECLDEIAALLAGRASEQYYCGIESAGASNDLEKASQLAYNMVDKFAFNNYVGKIYPSYRVEVRDNRTGLVKAGTNRLNVIDEEIDRILTISYQRALDIVKDNKDKIELIVKTLLKQEVIDADEIKRIMSDVKAGD